MQEIYERGQIDPRGITYAEMHGTGTVLGDPIELEALAGAFRTWTSDTGFCTIGSVKSNAEDRLVHAAWRICADAARRHAEPSF